jgi:hypothetical protein
MVGPIDTSSYIDTSGASGRTVSSASSEAISKINEQIKQLRSSYPKTSFSISPAFLKKMETDPAAAAKGKEILDGIPAAEEWLRNMLKQNGMEYISGGVMIDADGNMSSWSVTKTSTSSHDSDKTSNDKRKDLLTQRHVGDRKDTPMASVENLFLRVLENSTIEERLPSDTTDSTGKIDAYV